MLLINTILVILAGIANSQSTKQDEHAKEELEKYIQEAKLKVNSRYRLTYHISAPVGWINDPNGFSHFRGEYHLFYQYNPYDAVWGPMHWGHVSSPDLVHWRYRPTALLPDKEQCFSGSAVKKDESELVLMYTGHVATETEPFFNESQYLASSRDGVNFTKYNGNPVLPTSPNGNPDFRDPKVWRHLDHYYVILGSKTNDNRGRVLLYRSKDLIEWKFLTVLAESDGKMGYMWECPDFFEIDGKFILLMSPQGMEAEGDRYKNLYQTGYIVGDFNYDNFEFTPTSEFQELDYGHDFYAAQTQIVLGRRLLISWFGMWEVNHPEAADGWAGAMTIARQLKLTKDHRLTQMPVFEMLSLRNKITFIGELLPNEVLECGKAAEILVFAVAFDDISLSFVGKEGGGNITVKYDSLNKKIIVDRDGDVRQVDWSPDFVTLRIFLDTSSLELFCGNGEAVFSSRVYPLGGWVMKNTATEGYVKIRSYSLSKGMFT